MQTQFFGDQICSLASAQSIAYGALDHQCDELAHRTPRLLHFALPIPPRAGRITARQVRTIGLGLLLLSAWFFLAGFMGILGHH